MEKYGKDDPSRFIEGALTGGGGTSVKQGITKSNGITEMSIGNGQKINTATPMDNVEIALEIESSIRDEKFAGGIHNIEHSLTGADAVTNDVGAASKVKHQFDHGI